MKRSKGANPALFGKGVLELNPALGILPSEKLVAGFLSQKGSQVAKKGKRRREMNATEAEFAMILEARKRSNEIISYEYEGIMLRWGKIEQFRYSPDFIVVESITYVPPIREETTPHIKITLIEIKGNHFWKADLLRYKAARENWPLFNFEWWQKTKNGWEMTR